MRKIKFRYIVKHIESKNIEVKIYSLSQLEERPLKSLSPVFIQGYELLGKSQYIGLKDKNGIEIYEGDIVKCVGPHSPTVKWYAIPDFRYYGDSLVVTPSDAGIQLRVLDDYSAQKDKRFSPNGYRGGTKPPVDFYQFWNFQSSFEVIGNIHENPELLEQSS